MTHLACAQRRTAEEQIIGVERQWTVLPKLLLYQPAYGDLGLNNLVTQPSLCIFVKRKVPERLKKKTKLQQFCVDGQFTFGLCQASVSILSTHILFHSPLPPPESFAKVSSVEEVWGV